MEGHDGSIGANPTSAKYEPVTTISWRDCIVWCNAYSEMAGLAGIYYSDIGMTTLINDSSDGAYGSSINTALRIGGEVVRLAAYFCDGPEFSPPLHRKEHLFTRQGLTKKPDRVYSLT